MWDLEDKTTVFEFMKESSDKMSVIIHNHILEFKK